MSSYNALEDDLQSKEKKRWLKKKSSSPLLLASSSSVELRTSNNNSSSGNNSTGSPPSSNLSTLKIKANDVITIRREIANGKYLCDLNGRSVKLAIKDASELIPLVVMSNSEEVTVQSKTHPKQLQKRTRKKISLQNEFAISLAKDCVHPRQLEDALKNDIHKDVSSLKQDIESLELEFELIKKAFHQDFVGPQDVGLPPELSIVKTAEVRIFEKMIEAPYVRTVKTDQLKISEVSGNVQTNIRTKDAIEKATTAFGQEEVALAPAGSFFYRDILVPMYNLNSIPQADLDFLPSLKFDVFRYLEAEDVELPRLLIMTMFHNLNLFDTLRIDQVRLYRFLTLISSRYRNVPFHNWFHAFNVTQTMYFFLTTCNAKHLLGPLEILALLTATICHDADHPGLNNMFQAKASTKLATMHKKSVLENHHLLHACCALSNPECNFIQHLDSLEKDKFMRYLRDFILATDLSLHGIILRNMKESKKNISKQYQKANPVLESEDLITFMCCLVKCADLSNEIRPNKIAKRWASMVMQEFLKQNQKELDMSLPITPFMDPSKVIIAKEEMNFINNLCLPLYKSLEAVLPALSIAMKKMNKNLDHWNSRLNHFYSADQVEKASNLSNVSIWERKQVKDKKQKVSEAIGRQVSHK